MIIHHKDPLPFTKCHVYFVCSWINSYSTRRFAHRNVVIQYFVCCPIYHRDRIRIRVGHVYFVCSWINSYSSRKLPTVMLLSNTLHLSHLSQRQNQNQSWPRISVCSWINSYSTWRFAHCNVVSQYFVTCPIYHRDRIRERVGHVYFVCSWINSYSTGDLPTVMLLSNTLSVVPFITETESEPELATYTLFVVGLTAIAAENYAHLNIWYCSQRVMTMVEHISDMVLLS